LRRPDDVGRGALLCVVQHDSALLARPPTCQRLTSLLTAFPQGWICLPAHDNARRSLCVKELGDREKECVSGPSFRIPSFTILA